MPSIEEMAAELYEEWARNKNVEAWAALPAFRRDTWHRMARRALDVVARRAAAERTAA